MKHDAAVRRNRLDIRAATWIDDSLKALFSFPFYQSLIEPDNLVIPSGNLTLQNF